MAKYLIKDLEALSGIKAHTIRIWEQRYGILRPLRTETNIRQYNDDELRLLLNISFLNRNGFKISRLTQMSVAEMEEKVKNISYTDFEYHNQMDALVLAMVQMNEFKFEKIVNLNIVELGFEITFERILFPLMRKIGVMWQINTVNPSHEHFISNLIRQKLISAIDRTDPVHQAVSKALLFLPEGELHELSLLYLHFILKKRSVHVLYLGQNVPIEDLVRSCSLFKPNFMFGIFTSSPYEEKIPSYLSKLSKAFPKCKIYLSGFRMVYYKKNLPANIKIFKEISEIKDFHYKAEDSAL
ncbi:MAG: MerR family transcriptional regulator [Chitinophagales bacterium]|nr:MerR family transcriptional regulator [Chitinophagales bacterium]